MVIGCMVGSGIFRVPASVAGLAGTAAAMNLLWIGGGVLTLCLALSLAEVATMFPQAGGTYVYIREAYGPTLAFLYGWTFLLIAPAAWAALALIVVEYLARTVHLTQGAQRVLAIGLIASVTLSNYWSARVSAYIQNLATVTKVLSIAGVTLIVFTLGYAAHAAKGHTDTLAQPSVGSLGVALVSVLFSYEGAASFCAISGEVKNPCRTIPRALVLGVLMVIALYLLLTNAYMYVLSMSDLARSTLVASDAMSTVLGPIAASIASALVMVSSFGCLAALSISDPRVLCAMAQDGLFFRAVGSVHARNSTPHVAVLLSGTTASLYAATRSYEQLSVSYVLGLWPFYALAVTGVIVLRVRLPHKARPYRTLGYPLVPLVFVAATLLVLLDSLIEQPLVTLLNIAMTLAGLPVYYSWRAYAQYRKSKQMR